MSFLEIETVKIDFPLWNRFCSYDSASDPEAILQRQMDLADNKLRQYINIPSGSALPDWLQLHLFNIVRKFCFDIKHGDTEFQSKPTIVREYEATIEELKRIAPNGTPVDLSVVTNRITSSASTDKISINAKERLFGPGGGFASYEEVDV